MRKLYGFIGLVVVVYLAVSGGAQSGPPFWPQWARDSQHSGSVSLVGQELNRILTDIVYDPLVPQEQSRSGGELLAHYQVTLLDDESVFMEFKDGSFDPNNYASQIWGENGFQWRNGQLVKKWTYRSDWNPPGSLNKDFWEPVFHAVLANGFIYVPGASGTLWKLNTSYGTVVAKIDPFHSSSANIYTVSPPTADAAGNIYYNTLQLHSNSDFFSTDPIDSWIVKVTPAGVATLASYSAMLATAGAPGPNDQCVALFADSQLPWPPSTTAVPPTSTCGLQRVALNIAPALSPDEAVLYSVTRAHLFSRYGYLVAIHTSDLSLKWASSMRDRFHDGCRATAAEPGVLPLNGQLGGCRVGANPGVNPETNRPGEGRVLDDSSSSPTVAPDGSILYGAYSSYNYEQGHLMHFAADGSYLGSYGFGWDSTPAIYAHGGTYSIVIKDNHYSGLGSYCDVDAICPPDRTATNPFSPEAYFITQLSPSLATEWMFQSTNTMSCERQPNGTLKCASDHPHGFEWCVNAPVVDSNGVVYANSEDGNLYAISQGATLKNRLFQQLALGAAYTPASIDATGRIYSQNAGHLFVVGK